MAVIDKREIRFDTDDLAHCFAMLPRAAEGFGLSAMLPYEVQFFPNDKAIKLAYSKQDIEGTVRIAGASLTALLVSYCIRCKIPLPRISDKRIRVEEDCLVLEIRTTFNKAPAPEYAENAMRAAQAGKPAKWLASRKRAS